MYDTPRNSEEIAYDQPIHEYTQPLEKGGIRMQQLLGKVALQASLAQNRSLADEMLNKLRTPKPQLPSINWGRKNGTFLPNFLPPTPSTPPTIEDLPEMALPVLEFMQQVKPHIVIGCDRGGRLFSIAMHAAWRETHKGEPFPTLDSKIHFTRISKSESETELQTKVDAIIAASKKQGVLSGKVLSEDEQLRVLFVDCWRRHKEAGAAVGPKT